MRDIFVAYNRNSKNVFEAVKKKLFTVAARSSAEQANNFFKEVFLNVAYLPQSDIGCKNSFGLSEHFGALRLNQMRHLTNSVFKAFSYGFCMLYDVYLN